MADDRPDRPSDPERGPRDERAGDTHPPVSGPSAGGPGGEGPHGGRPTDPRSAGGKPEGSRPYGDRPRGGRPAGNRPYGNKPYGSKPYDRPAGQRPFDGRPGDRRDARPARERPPADGGPERPSQHGRHVDYSRQERPRGPRPQRGPEAGDRGPRRPRGDWDRRDRFAPPRSPRGPSPAELLGEDEEIVAGRRPVEEAFAARREAKRLLVVPERRAALDQLVLHATTLRIPVVEVEGGTITAVSGFDGHQGIALVVAARRWATLDEVLALAKSRGEPPFVLALDHLEDPQNVGTLLRSAEACGVHGVIFPTRGAAPISPAAVKTSAGAVEHLLLVPMSDLASSLVDLHARGLRVVGADGDARMTVREVDMRGPIVIVTGSEGRGLNARVRKRVDLMARIPMRGKVASLNASVAGSIFLFEAAAQRDVPESEQPVAPEPVVHAGIDEDLEPEPTSAADAEPPADASSAEPAPPAAEADDLLPEAPPPGPAEPR